MEKSKFTFKLWPLVILVAVVAIAVIFSITSRSPKTQAVEEPIQWNVTKFDEFVFIPDELGPFNECDTEVVRLQGPASLVEDSGSAIDTDGDGIANNIPIEIVEMNLAGESPCLGSIELTGSSENGQYNQKFRELEFPADSFFDISFWLNITLPGHGEEEPLVLIPWNDEEQEPLLKHETGIIKRFPPYFGNPLCAFEDSIPMVISGGPPIPVAYLDMNCDEFWFEEDGEPETQFPQGTSEEGDIIYSNMEVEYETPQGAGTVQLEGPVRVWRSDPDVGEGYEIIQTEMLSMGLSGDINLGSGLIPIQVSLNDNTPFDQEGEISPVYDDFGVSDYPAEGRQELLLNVDIEGKPTLSNIDPIEIQTSGIKNIPWINTPLCFDSSDDDGFDPVPLYYDAFGEFPPTQSNITITKLCLEPEMQLEVSYDFGDAPDDPENPDDYPTLLASDGARHAIVPGGPMLGEIIDADEDGQPSAGADGDDLDSLPDDEDGVIFTTPFTQGDYAEVDVVVSGEDENYYLDAWVDFNGDGDWDDDYEQIYYSEYVEPGLNTSLDDFYVPGPGDFEEPGPVFEGSTYARFRISSEGDLWYDGQVNDGEVEDYVVDIVSPPDQDGDGVSDEGDNCPLVPNPGQENSDGGFEWIECLNDSPDETDDGDDSNFEYSLPFTFQYFGRYIVAIDVDSNGEIELLEAGESCDDCDDYGTHEDNDYYDSVFALNDDLGMDEYGLCDEGDRVIVQWRGYTLDDESYDSNPLDFQAILYENGDVQWNFRTLEWSSFGYDLFSGLGDDGSDIDLSYEQDEEETSYYWVSGSEEINQLAGDNAGDACDFCPQEEGAFSCLPEGIDGNFEEEDGSFSVFINESLAVNVPAGTDLTDIEVEIEDEGTSFGQTVVSGVDLPEGETKTLYINAIANTNRVCVIDQPTVTLSELVSPSCPGGVLFDPCPDAPATATAGPQNQYTCTKVGGSGGQYVISGLTYSGGGEVQPEEQEEAGPGGSVLPLAYTTPPDAPKGGFQLIIEGGAERTDSRDVELTLIASNTTKNFSLANIPGEYKTQQRFIGTPLAGAEVARSLGEIPYLPILVVVILLGIILIIFVKNMPDWLRAVIIIIIAVIVVFAILNVIPAKQEGEALPVDTGGPAQVGGATGTSYVMYGVEWKLAAGESGDRTVCALFYGLGGHSSDPVCDSIFYEGPPTLAVETPPVVEEPQPKADEPPAQVPPTTPTPPTPQAPGISGKITISPLSPTLWGAVAGMLGPDATTNEINKLVLEILEANDVCEKKWKQIGCTYDSRTLPSGFIFNIP